MNKALSTIAAVLVLASSPAGAYEIEPEIGARGWFFAMEGEVVGTDLEAVGFNKRIGQPEFYGKLGVGNHKFSVEFLQVRREESGTTDSTVFGIANVRSDVTANLGVDYLRVHYGYDFELADWLHAEPFLEVAYLDEETIVLNRTTNTTRTSNESSLFPMLGLRLELPLAKALTPYFRVSGMGTGKGHIIDLTGVVQFNFGPTFLGAGYRMVDFALEDKQGDADLRLDGVIFEGGIKF